ADPGRGRASLERGGAWDASTPRRAVNGLRMRHASPFPALLSPETNMRIRPRFVLPLTLLALAACAGSDPAPGEGDEGERDQALLDARTAADSAATASTDSTTAPPPPSCAATGVQGLVGEPATEALVQQARTDASADQVRMLKPGQAVTLEF